MDVAKNQNSPKSIGKRKNQHQNIRENVLNCSIEKNREQAEKM